MRIQTLQKLRMHGNIGPSQFSFN